MSAAVLQTKIAAALAANGPAIAKIIEQANGETKLPAQKRAAGDIIEKLCLESDLAYKEQFMAHHVAVHECNRDGLGLDAVACKRSQPVHACTWYRCPSTAFILTHHHPPQSAYTCTSLRCRMHTTPNIH